jgi:signal transduction histidine kinase
MVPDEPTGTDLDIDLLAASLRADSGDVHTFVEALAAKLEDAVPGAVAVDRRRDGLFGPKLVRRIALDAGGRRLELRASGAGIQTSCGRLSGGIVLKSEMVDTDAWLRVLGEALAEQARHSNATRQALERLLNR